MQGAARCDLVYILGQWLFANDYAMSQAQLLSRRHWRHHPLGTHLDPSGISLEARAHQTSMSDCNERWVDTCVNNIRAPLNLSPVSAWCAGSPNRKSWVMPVNPDCLRFCQRSEPMMVTFRASHLPSPSLSSTCLRIASSLSLEPVRTAPSGHRLSTFASCRRELGLRQILSSGRRACRFEGQRWNPTPTRDRQARDG